MKFFIKFFRDPDAIETGSSHTPLIQAERITIIDSVRGIALLGILLMNIPFFSMAFQIGENLMIRNEFSGRNYYTWWIVNGFFEGTMRGLFSMLFGAGSILLLSRLEKKSGSVSAADVYYRRLIWLLIFGIINAFVFLWPGDILYSYAICGLLLFPFRNLSPKALLLFGLFFLLASGLKETLQMYDAKKLRVKGEAAMALEAKKVKLTDEQQEDKKKWEGRQERNKIENIRKEVDKSNKDMRKGYFAIMSNYKDLNQEIQSKVFYHFYFWDVMTFFLIGMAFFKWGILTGERSSRFYWTLILIGYPLGLLLNYWQLRTTVDVKFDRTLMADKLYVSFYQVRRLLLVMGHIGVVMLVYKHHLADWLLKALSRVGQMAFSNYLMQSIFCVFIFYGFGLRWFGALERYQIYFVVFGIWIFQIIFSNIWLKYFRFGPFEWVWRSLTYWKKQPMKRVAG